MRRAAWDRVIYVARYAKQPFDQIFPLTSRQMHQVLKAVGRVIDLENKSKK